ncbi:MAG TPA: hypothetical protein VE476_01110 [Propionibacteriaceae bacterium]|nr:hypothetical protein [Propionibacteriaceae bacterium]
MNPYQHSKRGADTFGLVLERRVRVHEQQDGTISPFNRRWQLTGGRIGWHDAFRQYANLYLDAGLIAYTNELRVGDWAQVYTTDAGRHLIARWRNQPFEVIETADIAGLIDRAAGTLSAAYVEESGLLEDQVDRYTGYLRPHAERVVRELLG